ncbi:MAG: Hsp20/alpha crystallin family protein [Candidatus Peribacteraceae bacterium]|jgi:HSP20 family protein|nr:Hsp20/alpha crystallin family protein [Candidatus Peribacteraceae bacterium]|tara:strand:+ start:14751 stop:15212 length:462 start_codon:yes stop_codon:yes gene_type:complete
MTPSPFHGIFSSFGQDQSTQTSDALPVQAKGEPVQEAIAHPQGTQTGQIAVDIYELDAYYIIRAPIAGVKLSDIDIEVDDKVLTIRGARKANDDIATDQFYLQECFWGDFERSITLPISIDPKKVKATFSKDAILKVIIPKEEKVKIVRISEG